MMTGNTYCNRTPYPEYNKSNVVRTYIKDHLDYTPPSIGVGNEETRGYASRKEAMGPGVSLVQLVP